MARLAVAESLESELPVAASRTHKDSRLTRSKCSSCVKKCLVFLLSYVGLITLVVAYSIFGGVIFMALEAPNEKVVKTKVATVRLKYINDLYNEFDRMSIFHEENWTVRADRVLRRFQKDIHDLVTKDGWDGDQVEGTHAKWTFAGSLLFSVTVITTIGYGTSTPKTLAGQSITMIYAVIGIPLTLLCLTTIGKPMAAGFRTAYGRTFCVSCRRRYKEIINRRQSHISLNKIELKNRALHGIENNEADGLIIVAICEEDHAETEVPFTTCLILIVWYIVFGAIMFTIWEKDWSLFTGSYYCFITLSTIGFGDIVPGLSQEDWNDQLKQVACALYLLIGLSTVAMCFELMQSKWQETAKRFAKCIGLVNE